MIDLVDAVHGARNRGPIRDGSANELAARPKPPRRRLIKNPHMVAALQKRGDKMLPDEPTSAGDQ
jgi:hypothetical protein